MVTDINRRTQRTVTHEVVTNIFTLYEDGTLIWKIRNQAPIVGLKAIQAELRRLQEALEPDALPESTS